MAISKVSHDSRTVFPETTTTGLSFDDLHMYNALDCSCFSYKQTYLVKILFVIVVILGK